MKTVQLSIDDLASLRSQWQRLADVMSSPLCGPDWFESYFSTYGTDGLQFLAVERNGGLAAIAPLGLRRLAGVSRLEFFDERIFEPHQFLFEDAEALEALLNGVLANRYPLALTRMPLASEETKLFAEFVRKRRCVWVKSARRSTSFVALGEQPFEQTMRTSALSQVRRKRRKAEQFGKVTFEFHYPTTGTVDAFVDEVYRVESSGWKGREKTGLLHDQTLGTFFRAFARRAAAKGTLHIGIARIGGEAAAVRLGVEEYGKLWESKIGYDERFASCSPGMLLTHETLLHLQAKGMKAHVFLGNYDRWQDIWNPVLVPFETLRIYPRSIRGATALATDAISQGFKRAKAKLGRSSS